MGLCRCSPFPEKNRTKYFSSNPTFGHRRSPHLVREAMTTQRRESSGRGSNAATTISQNIFGQHPPPRHDNPDLVRDHCLGPTLDGKNKKWVPKSHLRPPTHSPTRDPPHSTPIFATPMLPISKIRCTVFLALLYGM